MKSIHIAASLFAIVICVGMFGCKKQVSQPGTTNHGDSNHEANLVISSSWFSADWQNKQFNKPVRELTNDLLTTGKVLVFGEGGFEMRSPVRLPATLDANPIDVTATVGNLRFELMGNGAVSNSLNFRYILIPVSRLVSETILDYFDYNAVCAYYKII